MTYTNTQRSKAKYQIKQILAKTTANGCTDAEAQTAQTKAAVMMDKYGFTAADFVTIVNTGKDTFTVKTKPEPKAKKAKAPKGGKRGPAPQYADHRIISLLVKNPKKVGSKAFARYAKYRDGMTVGQAVEAGLTRDDFRWDTKKGHIEIK